MTLLCKLFGHNWNRREINPHKEKNYGYQPICERCDVFGEKERPEDWEENQTTIDWEMPTNTNN